jgi:hypothetical protein
MSNRLRRTAAVLMALAWLLHLANAQRGVSAGETTTFATPDGAFRFSYPGDFQVCTRGKIEPCTAHSLIPVCDQDALVCVVYAPEQFKDTSFGAASFEVKEILTEQQMMTADVCVTPYPRKNGTSASEWPDFLISAEHPVEMIGSVQFIHGVIGEAATSNWKGVDLYRAFHKQRCFELSDSRAGTDPNASDPPTKTLSPAQQKKLDQTMSQVLHSFRFSN